MFSNDDDQGLVLGVVFGVILLAIATVLGVALYKTGQRGAAPAPAAAVVAMPGSNAAAGAPAAEASGRHGSAGCRPRGGGRRCRQVLLRQRQRRSGPGAAEHPWATWPQAWPPARRR